MKTKKQREEAQALARYYFGYTFAGLDTYIWGYQKQIGIYIDSNNINALIGGLCEYITKEAGFSAAEAADIRRALDFIFFYKY